MAFSPVRRDKKPIPNRSMSLLGSWYSQINMNMLGKIRRLRLREGLSVNEIYRRIWTVRSVSRGIWKWFGQLN